jgi:hypothetical protein
VDGLLEARLAAALPAEATQRIRGLVERHRGRLRDDASRARDRADVDLSAVEKEDDKAAFIATNLRTYRRIVEGARLSEYSVLPFVRGFDEGSRLLSAFCDQLAEDVSWPKQNPLVSRAATDYFGVMVATPDELIFAPPLAGTTLLPLPDLVHEMAHALVGDEDYRETLIGEWDEEEYITTMVEQNVVGDQHDAVAAKKHWLEQCVTEFACDLIATYATGPAYAWQHLRWCAGLRTGGSVFAPGTDHPADIARFAVICKMLERLEIGGELDELRAAWSDIVRLHEFEDDERASSFYPDSVLDALTAQLFDGCAKSGIRPYSEELSDDDPCRILNEAWRRMRTDFAGFLEWESQSSYLLPTDN